MATTAAGTRSMKWPAVAGAAWLATFACAIAPAHVAAQSPNAPQIPWLDEQPLAAWNTPGAALPGPPAAEEDRARLIERCKLTPPAGSAGEAAVAAAGWVPFRLSGGTIVNGDIEIIGGMAGADGMCRPAPFNAFVFVGGQFAGTLSAVPMVSREDGSLGPVGFLDDDRISAEFARYAASDPLCCPSSRVAVRFRIDRSGSRPVVTPIDVQKVP